MKGTTKTDGRKTRGSIMAANVAHETIRRAMNGERINQKEIAVRNGYSIAAANAAKPQKTKTYRRIVEPFLDLLQQAQQQAITEIVRRGDAGDLQRERYRDLVQGVDTFTKNNQLLQGKATANVASVTVLYGSDDFLALQQNAAIDSQKKV